MRIYLDVCCSNRPFDDQGQARIRLESEAVIFALQLFRSGVHKWLTSEAVIDEIERIPDPFRKRAVELLLSVESERLHLQQRVLDSWEAFASAGLGSMDALHLAFAVAARCDAILTTDDQFRSIGSKLDTMPTRVLNPVDWILDQS